MRARLTCAAVCLLLVGADSGPTFLGETRLEFPPGSRWELIQGWKGDCPVTEASVEFLAAAPWGRSWPEPTGFRRAAQVKVTWRVLREKAETRLLYEYETGPKNGGLTCSGLGAIRIIGHRLVVCQSDIIPGFFTPPGELYLVLKPAK